MRLFQNQLWRKGKDHYRIVQLERLSVDYKKLDPEDFYEGTRHTVTKKEFCRLIKDATDVTDQVKMPDRKDWSPRESSGPQPGD